MTETLLSPSNILLFGRKVEDLEVVESVTKPVIKFTVDIAYKTNVTKANALATADQGVRLRKGMLVLLAGQTTTSENGLYKLDKDLKVGNLLPDQAAANEKIFVKAGISAKSTYDAASATNFSGPNYLNFDDRHSPFRRKRGGLPSEMEQQLGVDFEPVLARIYGFSFEGTYYDLPRPALFLVHGEGFDFTDPKTPPKFRDAARAPAEPSTAGVGTADFDFADDIRVWSYDKADYTIRMDVETGMFEDILLPLIDGGGPGVSGARVSGARVSGARVSGARVSGARVSGARLSGAND
jgi:hypothetical protein